MIIKKEKQGNVTIYTVDKNMTDEQADNLQDKRVTPGMIDYIIEHNAEIIKCADWVIDLGPEGGNTGGTIVFEGVPESLINCKESYTGHYLKAKLHSESYH